MGERLHGRMWLRKCLDTDMPILDHPAPSFTTSCPIRWKYTQAGVMKMSSTTSWSTCRSLGPIIRQSAGMLPCPKRYGIYFGDKFIQIYRWRIADHGGKYLSISYSNKRVVQLMGENGRVQNKRGGSCYHAWNRRWKAGQATGVFFGHNFVQVGSFLLGTVDDHLRGRRKKHFSVSHTETGQTPVIYRSDGRHFYGPRTSCSYRSMQACPCPATGEG